MHLHTIRRRVDNDGRFVQFTLDCAVVGGSALSWSLGRADAGGLQFIRCECGDTLFYFLSVSHFDKDGECRVKATQRGAVHAALFGSHDRCRCGVSFHASERVFHTNLPGLTACTYVCGVCVYEKPEVYRRAAELAFVMRTPEGEVWRCVVEVPGV